MGATTTVKTEKDSDKAELYKHVIEYNWNAIVFANMDGIVEFVNPAANELYGYEEGELIGQNVDIFNSHLTHNTEEIIEGLMSRGHWHGELIQRRNDDSTFDALLHVQLIKDRNGVPLGYSSNSKDITTDKRSAKKLSQIILEKEMLIKEIHHRVKNNLSIIQGMLRLQLDSLSEANLKEFLVDFQTRLSVLAEAHNSLSSATSMQEIDLHPYVQKIVEDVARLFKFEGVSVKLDLDIDSWIVSIDKAIPIGLIVNEVVTNAFKHAFSTTGVVEIKLSRNDKELELLIKDNGKGFDFSKNKVEDSLGMSLIDGLAAQLDGTYSFVGSQGTTFQLNCTLS